MGVTTLIQPILRFYAFLVFFLVHCSREGFVFHLYFFFLCFVLKLGEGDVFGVVFG